MATQEFAHQQSDEKLCYHGSCSEPRGSAFMAFIRGPWATVIAAAAVVISIGLIVLVVCKCLRTRKGKHYNRGMFGSSVLGSMRNRETCAPEFKIVPFREIEEATNDFHSDNILGKGAQGEVYLGRLNDNSVVAIKKLNDKAHEEFRREIDMLKSIRHSNIVLLVGCCFDNLTKIPYLIYEYLPVGSLFQLIHRDEEIDVPSGHKFIRRRPEEIHAWSTRHDIATKVAEGLAYLHSVNVMHRDIKSGNVLLDPQLEPKIADFGIAKRSSQEDEKQRKISELKGTYGYTCPEYCRDAVYDFKCDVYSFGVLLAELLTGKHALFTNEAGKVVDLATHFMQRSQTNLESILAEEIADSNEITMSVIRRVAFLVCSCVVRDRDERPEMKNVLVELQQMQHDLRGQTFELGSPSSSVTSPILGDRYV